MVTGGLRGYSAGRELNIAQRPVVFTLRRTLIFALLFASLGIFMAPYFLALTAEVTHYGLLSTVLNYVSATFTALLMIVSVALFYLVVLSEKGRGVWSWLVNRLSEVGYV
ncbi:hypothetical protein [Vulcanisaeta sp. JCM 14467]|uniref:hypothetical protein n=1 Tax=Vulcanisaeta sp. JCM 14467 TaxID=1295370 RepID=UPI0006CF2E00|nr:hypothetical protein [Vulcanisaeta sp. JCM 14467]